MTIVYASDENYAGLATVSAASVLRHNPGAGIVLLGCRLPEAKLAAFRGTVERLGGTFRHFDVSDEIEKLKSQGCVGYTSHTAYARAFAPALLADVPRILYLDCDTLVTGDVSPLFCLDMQGKPMALGGDCIMNVYHRVINHPLDLPYYNSGVMLIDTARWTESKCTERFLGELANPRGRNPLADQDVFVRLFPGEICFLPPKWNFLAQYLLLSYGGIRRVRGKAQMPVADECSQYEEARKHPAIWHFSGHTLGRPWYANSKHPMRKAYCEAAAFAGLPNLAHQTRSMEFCYRFQYWLHRLLPQWAFDIVCPLLYRLQIRRAYGV